MPLMLDDMRAEFARFLTEDPAARFRMDAALAHVITIAYEHGLDDGKASERESADYAWRNTNTIEKARQEEMAKRDALQAEVALLRHHLTELAKFADRAALVLVTIEAEDTTESVMLQDIIDGIQTWAPDALRGTAIATPMRDHLDDVNDAIDRMKP